MKAGQLEVELGHLAGRPSVLQIEVLIGSCRPGGITKLYLRGGNHRALGTSTPAPDGVVDVNEFRAGRTGKLTSWVRVW